MARSLESRANRVIFTVVKTAAIAGMALGGIKTADTLQKDLSLINLENRMNTAFASGDLVTGTNLLQESANKSGEQTTNTAEAILIGVPSVTVFIGALYLEKRKRG